MTMKRAAAMIALSLFPRLLVAQELDIAALQGEDWYGLYFGGQKAGYAVSTLTLEDDGSVRLRVDAQFKVNQGGKAQDLRVLEERRYDATGALTTVLSESGGAMQATRFVGTAQGDAFVLNSRVGGSEQTVRLPRPAESIADALKEVRLVQGDPEPGREIAYTRFEAMFQKEVTGRTEITGVEERVLNGAATKVYRVETTEQIDESNTIESSAWIAEDGTVLEDDIASVLVMRLEPKEVAQDVDYSNDVIVSNAALVDAAVRDPRTRETLRLLLEGPLRPNHLITDERQELTASNGGFQFVGRRLSLDGFTPATLPITDGEAAEWLERTTFIQSDDPRIVALAREIVGDETDAFRAVERLSRWVNENVRTSYSASISNALEVLDTLEGDCTEHSVLFVALARAAGIPAREVAGLIYVGTPEPGFYFHMWAKAWIGKWIDVDPTFNQPLADATHIKLAEGDMMQLTRLVPIIGRITVHVDEEQGAAAP